MGTHSTRELGPGTSPPQRTQSEGGGWGMGMCGTGVCQVW